MYWCVNNPYGQKMTKKLPEDSIKCKMNKCRFIQRFMQMYDHGSNKGYILEIDISYSKLLEKSQSDLPFFPENMKIENYHKLVCDMFDKKNSYT